MGKEGDDAKRIEGCDGGFMPAERVLGFPTPHCPHLKEVSSPTDMDGETYACERCGERFRLYYEDMA